MTINDKGAIPPDLRPDLEPVAIGGDQPSSRSSRVLNLALAAAVVVAIGGVAFAVGRGTAPASAATDLGAGGPRFGNGAFPNASGAPNLGGAGFGAGGAAGLSIEGTVTAVDADSMTIETTTGQRIELFITSGTEYHKQGAADASDVTTGGTVIVQTDGFAGRGQGGPGSSAAPSTGTGTGATATDITVVP